MGKRERSYIPYPERLAAALAQLLPAEDRDALRDLKVHAEHVIALFQFDHGILHALGGPDKWFNLWPMLKPAHREKSRRDTSIVAKVRRVAPEHEQFRARMLKPDTGKSDVTRDSRWGKRKLQSKNNLRRRQNADEGV